MNELKGKAKKVIYKYFAKAYRPDFLIIGAPKSGTTSLHFYLNQHPYLEGIDSKEIMFFNLDGNYNKGIQWYEDHFRSFKKKMFFESTPTYM